MLKLRKAAITGGLACGKSSVCQIFKQLGAYVVSADEVVHQNLSQNKKLIREVEDLLGPDILSGGSIDRKVVADKVFHRPELLKELEKLIHPVVEKEIEDQFQKLQKEGKTGLIIAEIPVLFESGLPLSFFDTIIVVTAPDSLCRERFKGTDGDYERRKALQIPLEEKVKQADYVIVNDKDRKHLSEQVTELYQTLKL